MVSNNKTIKMAKLYIKGSQEVDDKNPREETVKFLLDYSKALSVIKHKEKAYEMLLN